MSLLAIVLLAAPARIHAGTPITVTIGHVVEAFHPIALAAAPNGSLILACMEDGSDRIIDAKTHQTVRVLAKHPDPAYAAAWSPNGQIVATGDERARIWLENALTGVKIREYRTHTKGIQKLSFNSFGNLLISTGKDDQVNVYDLGSKSAKEAKAILGHGVNFYGAAFNPQSTRIFTVGMLGGGMREYDASTGKLNRFYPDNSGQGIFDVCFNPAGTYEVSAGRDGVAKVWSPKTNSCVCSLKGHGDWVTDSAVSPNGVLAATSSVDRTVKVWNLKTMQKVADLPGQASTGSPLCFTADGQTLVSVNDSGFLEFNPVSPAQNLQKVVQPITKKAKRRHRSS